MSVLEIIEEDGAWVTVHASERDLTRVRAAAGAAEVQVVLPHDPLVLRAAGEYDFVHHLDTVKVYADGELIAWATQDRRTTLQF